MRINGSVGKNGYTFYALVTETIPTNYITTNQTIVNYEVYLENGNTRTNTNGWTFNAKIDGTNVYSKTSQNLNTTTADYHESVLIFSGTKRVTHNDNGAKTITFSSFLSKSSYGTYDPGYCSLSGTFTLTTIPRASTPTINTIGTNSPNFNIGDTITIYSNKKANFSHKAYIDYGSQHVLIGTLIDSIEYDTSTIANALYQLIPNSASYSNVITLETYDSSNTLIGTNTCSYTARVVNSNPTYDIAYQDTKASTLAITGNNQQIIQNNSTLQFNITNATALNYASLSSVSITINGITQTQSISSATLNVNFGVVNVANDTNAVVVLTDSRGLTTTKNVAITILAWQTPTAIITLGRKSNFYTETDILVDGDYSSLDSKNTLTIQYRIKKTSDANWGAYSTLTDNVNTTFNADNLYEWNVQVLLTDLIGSTTYNLTLGIGQPIMFVDRRLRNVGINCFADSSNALEVQGQAKINGNVNITGDLVVNNVNVLEKINNKGRMVLNFEYSTAFTTSSTTAVSVPDSNTTLTTYGGDVLVSVSLCVGVSSNVLFVYVFVDGATKGRILNISSTSGRQQTTGNLLITGLASGSHTFELKAFVQNSSNTATFYTYNTQQMTILEL